MAFKLPAFLRKLPRPEASQVADGAVGSGHILFSALGWAVRAVGTVALVFITTAAISAVVFAIYLTQYLEVDMDVDLDDFVLNQTSIVYTTDPETGETYELETFHGAQNRIMATFAEVPQTMIDALVAIEDKRFFEHKGVDWKRTVKAVQDMLTGGSSGGSTITQQLIKNITGDKEVTVQRKVQEIFRALDFEKKYSKERILEGYMNTSYFGEGTYGVKAAARVYFGKELDELTLAESACIIGITNAPTAYDPYLNPDKSKKRQTTILKAMLAQGKINEREYDAAVAQQLVLVRDDEDEDTSDGIQSYFVDQIFYDATRDLQARKGVTKQVAQTLMYNGGYRIYSTLDTRIQGIIDDVYSNDENFPVVKDSEKPQSSILLMDPYSGDVLGLGQRGTKTGNLQRVLTTMSRRQPGSSIKPITVYGAAMDAGYITPYSVITDAPLINANNAWPKNSGGKYMGQTPIITAVQNSVNTIAVRIVTTITPRVSFEFGHRLGLTSLLERKEINTSKGTEIKSDISVAPMALGGLTNGLTVRELTAAYCAYPNRGVYNAPKTYTHITDSDGGVILDNRQGGQVLMKEKTAYYLNTVLQQVVKAGTGTRAKFGDMTIAGKTGTTSDDFDRWFIGYTPYYAAGAWFGFDIPKKIRLEDSTNPALAMWKLVMERVHEGLETKLFFEPEGLETYQYCIDSGLAATEACANDPRGTRAATAKVYKSDVVKEPCNVHKYVDYDSVTHRLATPYCPPENITKVALMDLPRGLLTDGVTVLDEGFTIPGPVGEGLFRPYAPADAFNQLCHVHETYVPPPVDTTDPASETSIDPPEIIDD
ncbi:hypothetical protein FACS1894208_08710 [Clostridia bacterium]|nr:hypothetical protein FACS1894208_08710 [Clostridia bacterium]